jgi:hypothetical protein
LDGEEVENLAVSESYEGVIFRATEGEARDAFLTHPPSFPARLVSFSSGIFGAYRDVGREPFDTGALHQFAASLSEGVGVALAVSYDNGCAVRESALFHEGRRSMAFGEADEEWVPLNEEGMPIEDSPRIAIDRWISGEEYDCIRDAIRLGLDQLGVRPFIDADDLKEAFCYGSRAVLEAQNWPRVPGIPGQLPSFFRNRGVMSDRVESAATSPDWRQPPDDFARQLDAAREALLTYTADPWHAVALFEPILEDLNYEATSREAKLLRVRGLGRELFAKLRSATRPIVMEVRHYCWHLQYLGDPDGSPASSLKDILMLTMTRFAQYESHDPDQCFLCAGHPKDLPFRGSPVGRTYFDLWLKRKFGDDDLGTRGTDGSWTMDL